MKLTTIFQKKFNIFSSSPFTATCVSMTNRLPSESNPLRTGCWPRLHWLWLFACRLGIHTGRNADGSHMKRERLKWFVKLELCFHIFVDYISFFRDVCTEHFRRCLLTVLYPGKVVEVDETLLAKKKYNRSRMMQRHWCFGLIGRRVFCSFSERTRFYFSATNQAVCCFRNKYSLISERHTVRSKIRQNGISTRMLIAASISLILRHVLAKTPSSLHRQISNKAVKHGMKWKRLKILHERIFMEKNT